MDYRYVVNLLQIVADIVEGHLLRTGKRDDIRQRLDVVFDDFHLEIGQIDASLRIASLVNPVPIAN